MDDNKKPPLESVYIIGIGVSVIYHVLIAPIFYILESKISIFLSVFFIFFIFGVLFGLDLLTNTPIPGKPILKTVTYKDCRKFALSVLIGFIGLNLLWDSRLGGKIYSSTPLILYSGVLPSLSAYIGSLGGKILRNKH
jgi:hypothetical protein